MRRKEIAAVYGGGCEVAIEAEEKVNHLTVKLQVEVPVEEEYPHHGTEKHSGYMHVAFDDVQILRDALTAWLEKNGA